MDSNLEIKLSCKYKQFHVTGILLIGSLGFLKEEKTMDMILKKCKFPNSFFLFSVAYVVGTH